MPCRTWPTSSTRRTHARHDPLLNDGGEISCTHPPGCWGGKRIADRLPRGRVSRSMAATGHLAAQVPCSSSPRESFRGSVCGQSPGRLLASRLSVRSTGKQADWRRMCRSAGQWSSSGGSARPCCCTSVQQRSRFSRLAVVAGECASRRSSRWNQCSSGGREQRSWQGRFGSTSCPGSLRFRLAPSGERRRGWHGRPLRRPSSWPRPGRTTRAEVPASPWRSSQGTPVRRRPQLSGS